ncbi:MAG: hypothetical protein CMQ40_12770 [Gammaproteobacteria bacterium]|nr:hypothetical protein [Gammaproteobacteria bacterium]|tara:strand:+ start:336 stop:683 length:348 start_codon:yes stop_codon:yes gene_type:complete
MPDTFLPAVEPEVGAGAETEFRARVLSFGDGYEQRVADGINAKRLKATLIWRVLNSSDADAIEGFFWAHPSWVAFLYVLPWETSARKFRVEQLSRTATGISRASITAQLVEVFDL